MIRTFARIHPRTIALGLLIALTLTLTLPYVIWGTVDVTEGTGVMGFDDITNGIVWQALLAAILLLIVCGLKWWDITGFQGPFDRRGMRSAFWVGAFPAIGGLGFAVALLGAAGPTGPVAIIFIVLTLNFLVGFSEELMFRGFVFGALRQKNHLFAAICMSSLFFGMMHLANLGLGQALSLTAFQVINATALGALFCAIRLQTNSIWPPIFLHMLWNSYVMLGQALSEAQSVLPDPNSSTQLGAASLILPAILLIITFWILRGYMRRTGQSLFHHAPSQANMPTIGA